MACPLADIFLTIGHFAVELKHAARERETGEGKPREKGLTFVPDSSIKQLLLKGSS
jgi:hypothetical protein